MTTPTPFPPANTPAVDTATGQYTPQWYLTQFAVYNASIGTSGISLASVNATATNALNTAKAANTTAVGADEKATVAENTANSASVAAGAAQATASAAYTLATSTSNRCLYAVNNLSDVTSASSARSNLGVNLVPIYITYDGMPANGLLRYYPIIQPTTLPANFANTQTHCGAPATADAVFSVSYIRSGVATFLGTITLINGGQYNLLSGSGVSLQVGDVLRIEAPSPADSTLENVGITLSLSLT